MSIISDAHDIHCGCERPFAHLLDSIFPEGHTDRDKTIREIITRDLQCLSTGEEEKDGGIPVGVSAGNLENIKDQEEDFKEDIKVEDLLAAAAAAEAR